MEKCIEKCIQYALFGPKTIKMQVKVHTVCTIEREIGKFCGVEWVEGLEYIEVYIQYVQNGQKTCRSTSKCTYSMYFFIGLSCVVS